MLIDLYSDSDDYGSVTGSDEYFEEDKYSEDGDDEDNSDSSGSYEEELEHGSSSSCSDSQDDDFHTKGSYKRFTKVDFVSSQIVEVKVQRPGAQLICFKYQVSCSIQSTFSVYQVQPEQPYFAAAENVRDQLLQRIALFWIYEALLNISDSWHDDGIHCDLRLLTKAIPKPIQKHMFLHIMNLKTMISWRLRGIGIGASEGPISLDDFRNLQWSNTFQEKDEEIEAEGANYLLEMMRCIREVNLDNNIVGCNVPAYMITCGNCGHGADLRGFPQSPLFLEGNSKNCSSPDAGFCEGIFEEMSKYGVIKSINISDILTDHMVYCFVT
ncbi:putative serine protease EDA2 [Artemisia annua]|uniref:Putative serine protease EDA2 n=1 Tax=Artemisia annua TaxID=35608 RepID=A0A2U1PFV9_ARTAN|nr:putative serine protease EDA2 [Artemisia annua]